MSFTNWKSMAGIAGTALTLGLAGPALAQNTILTFDSTPYAPPSTGITWDSTISKFYTGPVFGSDAKVDLTVPSVLDFDARWRFTGSLVAGSAVDGAIQTAVLDGNFWFDASVANGGNRLLQGNYLGANLTYDKSTQTLTISSLNDTVQYTAGTEVPVNPIGNFEFVITGHGLGAGGFAISGGNITTPTFYAQAAGTFSDAVPEPGEWAAMGILASGLTGLMVRARRRK